MSAAIVVIRADASSDIGGGHVYRCLTLADSLSAEGMYVHFICRRETGHLGMYILERGYAVTLLDADEPIDQGRDAEACRALLEILAPDLIIVDHYGLSRPWQQWLSPLSQYLMVIDDLANRPHDCDLLFDQSLGRRESDYTPWVDSRCKEMILGAQYALLREQFGALSEQARIKRRNQTQVSRLLVAMGATDPDNRTLDVLKALEHSSYEISVILTDKARHLESVKDYTSEHGIELLVNVENMAEQILHADVAIAAAGTSVLERSCLGLPSVILCLAENQRHIAQALKSAGAVVGVLSPQQLQTQLQSLINDFAADMPRYKETAERCFELCRGEGARFVAEKLKALLTQPAIHLTKVRPEDMVTLYHWQQAPQTRQYSRNPEPPKLAQHRRWFDKIVDDPQVDFYLIRVGDKRCGYLRLNPHHNGFEVSIALAPDAYGLGLGHKALRQLSRLHPNKKLLAFIEPENIASVKAFAKAGFKPSGGKWYTLEGSNPA